MVIILLLLGVLEVTQTPGPYSQGYVMPGYTFPLIVKTSPFYLVPGVK